MRGLIREIIGGIVLGLITFFFVISCLVIRSYAAEKWTPAGEFKITHYCSCEKCCGKGDTDNRVTRSGTKPKRYQTVAVDTDVIPLGTVLYIDTYGYRIAEDTGGAVNGKHIDVFTPSHKHAEELGVQYQRVWIVEKGE